MSAPPGRVLVTGANSGLGLEVAAAFLRGGYEVFAAARETSALRELHERVGDAPTAPLHEIQLDLSSSVSIAGAVEAVRELGAPDVIVNNAGICTVGALEAVDDQALRKSFEVNFFGPLALTRALAPSLRASARGRVVFVGAVGAILNTPFLGAYCAAKHAIDCASATLDVELRPFGIRCVAVHPGPLRTPITSKMAILGTEAGVYASATQRYAAGLRARIDASVDDVAAAAEAIVALSALDDPEPRYVLSSALETKLAPVVAELARLHAGEVSASSGLWGAGVAASADCDATSGR